MYIYIHKYWHWGSVPGFDQDLCINGQLAASWSHEIEHQLAVEWWILATSFTSFTSFFWHLIAMNHYTALQAPIGLYALFDGQSPGWNSASSFQGWPENGDDLHFQTHPHMSHIIYFLILCSLRFSYVSRIYHVLGFIELDDGKILHESPIFDGKNHGFL